MIFRLANEDDINDILALYDNAKKQASCLWDEYYPNINTINNDLKNKGLYVLQENNEIIGSIAIAPNDELCKIKQFKEKHSACELARLVVKDTYQANGYGKYMVEEVEKILIVKNINAIHLLAGINNHPACKIYKNLNYDFLGIINMFENDFYICEKILKKGE